MSQPTRSRPFLLCGTLLAGCLAIFSLPGQHLRAANCGELGDLICRETRTCSKFWFFYYNCSSSFEYLSDRNEEPEEPEEPDVDEGPPGTT